MYVVIEDHIDRNLLFAGTEFGLFVTTNGGQRWTRLRGGLPTIQVRDLAIQKREDDLVVATFGRGFYILDDLSPLRALTPQVDRARRNAAAGQARVDVRALEPVRRHRRELPGLVVLLRAESGAGRRVHVSPEPRAARSARASSGGRARRRRGAART